MYDEAMRLGAQYRRSQPTAADEIEALEKAGVYVPLLMDSDHVSMIDRAGPEETRILARIVALPPDSVAASLISYEEQMRGWMAEIARMQSVDRQLAAYSRLDRMRFYYCVTPVLPFDENALAQFQNLWLRRLRVGTMDLKIVATALANGATLITGCTTDFGKVVGLKMEDWSGE